MSGSGPRVLPALDEVDAPRVEDLRGRRHRGADSGEAVTGFEGVPW